MTKTESLPTLETSLDEITSLVEKMEGTDLTLEQSLAHFERGVKLVKHCQKILEQAEQKVQMLVQTNTEEKLVPYPGEASPESDGKPHDQGT
jgi:exodeoxyribonuclease VII small subunit